MIDLVSDTRSNGHLEAESLEEAEAFEKVGAVRRPWMYRMIDIGWLDDRFRKWSRELASQAKVAPS